MENILDSLAGIKETLTAFLDKAFKQKWITGEDRQRMLASLAKEKITIGIIGQMKNGKSTLMNALVFGKNVLPSATVPMTATLTVITYGEKEYAEVEFYTLEEWANLQKMAAMDEDSDRVKSARELVDQAAPLMRDLPKLLGTKKPIALPEMIDYASADGRYSAITKSITIYHPHPRLASADFVDTPGFNDPVVSREQKTKEFLEKADVAIVVLFAGRPFDEKDRSILFDQIRAVGAGKIVLVVNKYDLVIDSLGSEQKVLANVEKKLKEGIDDIAKTDPVLAAVFKEGKPVLFSSLFALFGKMEPGALPEGELKEYYQQFRDNFPQIKTKQDFLHWSKIDALENQLSEIIKKERLAIIVRKPAAELIAKLKTSNADRKEEIIVLEKTKEALAKSSATLTQEIADLENVSTEIKLLVGKTELSLRESILTLCRDAADAIAADRDAILQTDINNLPARRFMQPNDPYMNECKRFVEDKLMAFRSSVSRKLKELAREVLSQFKKQTRELDKSITDIAKRKLRSNAEALDSLKRSFFDLLEYKASEIDYQIDISISGAWGFFFGVTRDIIMDEIRRKVASMFSDRFIDDHIGQIKQPAQSLLTEFDKFAEKTITPLQNALYNAAKMKDEDSGAQEGIGPKIDLCKEAIKQQTAFLQEMERFFQQYIN